MYEYPYGNSQQLNLDWILNKLKEFETSGASSADMKSIANALLSASYDSNSSYAINDIIYNDTLETLYICNTVIPVGGEPWDATHWDAFRVGDILTYLINAKQNLSSDDVANDSNVTGAGLTAALNALVEDVKYNNHYLQQKKNGGYSNVIAIEDTPSNNSDRLASSKAAYDLKDAITQKADISLFKRIGIIGDSYSAGEQYYGGAHHDLPTLSWGAMLAREAGISAEIYAKGGQTVSAFLDSTDASYNTVGYGKVVKDKNDAYHNVGLFLIALGLNDANTDSSGSNVSTFSSNLATLIDNINTLYSNYARIVLLTFKRLRNTVASDNAYNTAIINTATAKNVPVIDIRELDYFKSTAYTENYDSSSHPTIDNYAGMGHALKDAIEATICGNSYFDGYRNLNVWNDLDIVLNSIKKSQSTEQKQTHTINVPNSSAHLLLIYGGGAVTYGVLFVTATSGGITGAIEISIGTGAAAPVIAENTGNITVTYNSNRTLYMYDFLVYGDFCSIT